MKKLVSFLLAVIYMLSVSGATIHRHYCMGRLVQSGFGQVTKTSKSCINCRMEKKKGCCEDRHELIKVDKKYDQSGFQSLPPKTFINHYSKTSIIHTAILTVKDYFNNAHATSPPFKGTTPLFIRYCIYRI